MREIHPNATWLILHPVRLERKAVRMYALPTEVEVGLVDLLVEEPGGLFRRPQRVWFHFYSAEGEWRNTSNRSESLAMKRLVHAYFGQLVAGSEVHLAPEVDEIGVKRPQVWNPSAEEASHLSLPGHKLLADFARRNPGSSA